MSGPVPSCSSVRMHLTNVYNFGLPIYCFSDVWCVVLLCFVAHSIQRFTERSRLLTVAGLLHSLTSDSDTRCQWSMVHQGRIWSTTWWRRCEFCRGRSKGRCPDRFR